MYAIRSYYVIPLAEDSGLIEQIGRYVLETACRQLALWQHQLPPGTRIGVNVSSRQMSVPGFAGVVEHVITSYSIHYTKLYEIAYEQLLDAFFAMHDPTQVDRQGPDVGRQYRSVIFVHDAAQEAQAKAKIAALASAFSRPIATQVQPAGAFWRAEEYHP